MDHTKEVDKVLLMSRIIQEAPELFLFVTEVFRILDSEFRHPEITPSKSPSEVFYYHHWKTAGDLLTKILDCSPICDEIIEKLKMMENVLDEK